MRLESDINELIRKAFNEVKIKWEIMPFFIKFYAAWLWNQQGRLPLKGCDFKSLSCWLHFSDSELYILYMLAYTANDRIECWRLLPSVVSVNKNMFVLLHLKTVWNRNVMWQPVFRRRHILSQWLTFFWLKSRAAPEIKGRNPPYSVPDGIFFFGRKGLKIFQKTSAKMPKVYQKTWQG